jgi:hypothetical protein
MLVVVAAGERAEAILLLGGKLYDIEDDNASAAFRFLVRGEMVKFWSGSEWFGGPEWQPSPSTTKQAPGAFQQRGA